MTKKKKIIIVSICVVLVAAVAITIGVVCSKKSHKTNQDETQVETVLVTDENGETVTDENGNPVTQTKAESDKTETNGKNINNNENQNDNTTSGSNGDSSSGSSNGKSEETTESTTHFTTVNPNENQALPEDSFDDTIPEYNALLVLQEYYKDDYVVNYDRKNYTDDTYSFAVFEKSGNGSTIAYTVTVDIVSGKTLQTNANGKTTDISNRVSY